MHHNVSIAQENIWTDFSWVSDFITFDQAAIYRIESTGMAIQDEDLDFLIVGVGKSGTTSLANILAQHAQIAITLPKEPWFFDSCDFHHGMRWYWQQYLSHYAGEERVGEASSQTLFVPYAAERIYSVMPEAKLIAILREPVGRAHSDWWMKRSAGIESDDFATSVDKNLASLEQGQDFSDPLQWQAHLDTLNSRLEFKTYVDYGCYASQLERYLHLFPAEQIMVLLTEDLQQNPLESVAAVCRFLDVPDQFLSGNVDLAPKNTAISPAAARLRRAVHAVPAARAVYDGLTHALPAAWRDALTGRLRKLGPVQKPPIPARTRLLLEEFYQPEIARLEAMIDRDLSHWVSVGPRPENRKDQISSPKLKTTG